MNYGSTSGSKLHTIDCRQFVTYTRQFIVVVGNELPESFLVYGGLYNTTLWLCVHLCLYRGIVWVQE